MRNRFATAVILVLSSLILFFPDATHAGRQADTKHTAAIPLAPYLRAQAVVHAVVNGHAGTFLFDTGEGVSSISPTFAETIGCHPWGRITGFRMSGERLDLKHCDNVEFNMAGRKLIVPAVGIIDIMRLLGPGVPPVDGSLGLDVFSHQIITIIPRKAILFETPASLAARIRNARELPIRMVRDVEGVALSVDGAVPTAKGTAWMELDNGNGGSLVVANHIAPLLGLKPDMTDPQPGKFQLANGIPVEGTIRTRDLIMDGNISAQFLNGWTLTLDLERGRAWLAPLPADATHK